MKSGPGDVVGLAVLAAVLVAVIVTSGVLLWRARRAESAVLVDDEATR